MSSVSAPARRLPASPSLSPVWAQPVAPGIDGFEVAQAAPPAPHPLIPMRTLLRTDLPLHEAVAVGAASGAACVIIAGIMGRAPLTATSLAHGTILGALMAGFTHGILHGTDALRATIASSTPRQPLAAFANAIQADNLSEARKALQDEISRRAKAAFTDVAHSFAPGILEGALLIPQRGFAIHIADRAMALLRTPGAALPLATSESPGGGTYLKTLTEKVTLSMVVAPIVEEFIYRKTFLEKYDSARQGLNAAGGRSAQIAALMSRPATLQFANATLFGAVHLRNDHGNAIAQAIYCAASARMYLYLYEKHGLGGAMGAHFLNNALATLLS